MNLPWKIYRDEHDPEKLFIVDFGGHTVPDGYRVYTDMEGRSRVGFRFLEYVMDAPIDHHDHRIVLDEVNRILQKETW